MVGSSIVRKLLSDGYLEDDLVLKTHSELDLTDQKAVQRFFSAYEIGQVYLAAAKVGGIHANMTSPAEFIYENLMIQSNVINSAFNFGVKKLVFLGSSCIYPALSPQPIREEYLLTGLLEETNEAYAIAKIAGIKLCESYNRQYSKSHGVDFRAIMPTNLYGPGDNYHASDSHVIPALLRKFHTAKVNNARIVELWGSGTPKREFLYVDDLASAATFFMGLDKKIIDSITTPMCSHVNVGYGSDITISDLANLVAEIVGYAGDIAFDKNKADGVPRKLLDSKMINDLGWQAQTSLSVGIQSTYAHFMETLDKGTCRI